VEDKRVVMEVVEERAVDSMVVVVLHRDNANLAYPKKEQRVEFHVRS
jgi:hypothetical protein